MFGFDDKCESSAFKQQELNNLGPQRDQLTFLFVACVREDRLPNQGQ